jgi:hypothetical protein
VARPPLLLHPYPQRAAALLLPLAFDSPNLLIKSRRLDLLAAEATNLTRQKNQYEVALEEKTGVYLDLLDLLLGAFGLVKICDGRQV